MGDTRLTCGQLSVPDPSAQLTPKREDVTSTNVLDGSPGRAGQRGSQTGSRFGEHLVGGSAVVVLGGGEEIKDLYKEHLGLDVLISLPKPP